MLLSVHLVMGVAFLSYIKIIWFSFIVDCTPHSFCLSLKSKFSSLSDHLAHVWMVILPFLVVLCNLIQSKMPQNKKYFFIKIIFLRGLSHLLIFLPILSLCFIIIENLQILCQATTQLLGICQKSFCIQTFPFYPN